MVIRLFSNPHWVYFILYMPTSSIMAITSPFDVIDIVWLVLSFSYPVTFSRGLTIRSFDLSSMNTLPSYILIQMFCHWSTIRSIMRLCISGTFDAPPVL